MSWKQVILHYVETESKICKHLASKLKGDAKDFRFSPDQRSTEELMRYLCHAPYGGILWMSRGDRAYYEAEEAKLQNFSIDQFDTLIDQQAEKIKAFLEPYSDQDLIDTEITLTWGAKEPLAQTCLFCLNHFFVAYRMQLFLQIKAACAPEMNTMDCWVGTSKTPDIPAPE